MHEQGISYLTAIDSPVIEETMNDIPVVDGEVPIIFPESKKLIEKMSDSSFSFDSKVDINFPFKNFVLAMPKGIEREGMKVKGIMVKRGQKGELLFDSKIESVNRIIKKDMRLKEKTDPYLIKALEVIKQRKADSSKYEDEFFHIEVNTGDDLRSENLSFMIRSDFLSLALKAKDPNELNSLMEKHKDERDHDCIDEKYLSEKGGRYIYDVIRIVASMGVYMSLDNKLKEGLPNKHLSEQDKAEKQGFASDMYFVESMPSIESSYDGDKKAEHYRRSHFRNLRDERYYRNEHADKERGSRWVVVRDSLVSKQSDPFTLSP